MARLSEENFKSSPGTPARKPNRFKEMFRHRTSTSSSSASPETLTESQPVSSPLDSPTLKLGFEQVGLLPSERMSLETAKRELEKKGGTAINEAIEKEVLDLKDVSVPHNLDTGLDASGATHADEAAKKAAKEARLKEKHSVEQSFKNALSKYQSEHAEGDVDMVDHSNLPILDAATAELVNNPTTHPLPALNSSGANSFYEAARGRYSPSWASYNTANINEADPLERDDAFVNYGDHIQASNTFDDSDSLSQAICKRVTSKVAEAMVEYEQKHMERLHTTTGVPVHVTINLNMRGVASTSNDKETKQEVTMNDILTGSKSIGPLAITYPRIAADFQLAVIAVYLTFILGSAFLGPKTLLLTIWKTGIVLAVYATAIRRLGWEDDMHSDVLLSPACWVGRELQHLGGEVFEKLGAAAALILVEALRSVAKSAEVNVEQK